MPLPYNPNEEMMEEIARKAEDNRLRDSHRAIHHANITAKGYRSRCNRESALMGLSGGLDQQSTVDQVCKDIFDREMHRQGFVEGVVDQYGKLASDVRLDSRGNLPCGLHKEWM